MRWLRACVRREKTRGEIGPGESAQRSGGEEIELTREAEKEPPGKQNKSGREKCPRRQEKPAFQENGREQRLSKDCLFKIRVT